MSLLSLLIFISQGSSLRRAYSKKALDDATYLELFFRILSSQDKCPSKLGSALEQGINLIWEDVYDFVDPFGDSRGCIFDSVWTFNIDEGLLFLRKKDHFSSVPLELARERPLTLDDLVPLSLVRQPSRNKQILQGPYWDPKLDISPRERAFLGRLLRDFAFTWRHILQRQINTMTFMKLANAIIWISTMNFTIFERMGFEHISDGGPYVQLVQLPGWETPAETFIQAESSWFVLACDAQEGLEMIQRHISNTSSLSDSTVVYVILTPWQVTLCKADGDRLVWTKSETLFDTITSDTAVDIVIYDAAIDMILWAANLTSTELELCTLYSLPIEIQDRILYYATTSVVASAKLGCELGLGSPSSWTDRGVKIRLERAKRHRFETSPVESHIVFNGVMSGLSYKRELGYQTIYAGRTAIPAPGST